MTAERARDLAVSIGDRLCDEAIVADDQATWSGAQQQLIDGEWQVVEATVGPELYGGTAGIALFLARLGATIGGPVHLEVASQAARHALASVSPEMGPSLYAGSAGIAAAVAEVATLTGDAALSDRAHELAIGEPDAADLIVGSAGMIMAGLSLHRDRPDHGWLDQAESWAADLLERSETDDSGSQRWWPSDIAGHAEEPPLLGLGHGAAGCAWPLAELAAATREHEWFAPVEEAVAYERTWLDHERGNWPDLRELTTTDVAAGKEPAWPAFWCHGAPGIGLTRLRFYEMTGDRRYADEANIAIVSALRFSAEMGREAAGFDASLCHGLAAVIELLRDAASILRDPSHLAAAFEVVEIVEQMVTASGGQWPSGVRDGGENPSLMLGMAGIGGALLNLAIDEPLGFALPWRGKDRAVRINAKAVDVDAVPRLGRQLMDATPGLRLERASKSGRMLLTLAASCDPGPTVDQLRAEDQLEWVEFDGPEGAAY